MSLGACLFLLQAIVGPQTADYSPQPDPYLVALGAICGSDGTHADGHPLECCGFGCVMFSVVAPAPLRRALPPKPITQTRIATPLMAFAMSRRTMSADPGSPRAPPVLKTA